MRLFLTEGTVMTSHATALSGRTAYTAVDCVEGYAER